DHHPHRQAIDQAAELVAAENLSRLGAQAATDIAPDGDRAHVQAAVDAAAVASGAADERAADPHITDLSRVTLDLSRILALAAADVPANFHRAHRTAAENQPARVRRAADQGAAHGDRADPAVGGGGRRHMDEGLHDIGLHRETAQWTLDICFQVATRRLGRDAEAAQRLHQQRSQAGRGRDRVARIDLPQIAAHPHGAEVDVRGVDVPDVDEAVTAVDRAADPGHRQRSSSRTGADHRQINELELLRLGVIAVNNAGVELEHVVDVAALSSGLENLTVTLSSSTS